MKRRMLILSSVALVALLAMGMVGGVAVLAQDVTPEPEDVPDTRPGFGGAFGWGGHSRHIFDALAEALGLTPTELFERWHDGQTLEEIAEAEGVDLDELQETLRAARADRREVAIEQAVEDGKITQEHADWLLEGQEKGFIPHRLGARRGLPALGRGRGGFRGPMGDCPMNE